MAISKIHPIFVVVFAVLIGSVSAEIRVMDIRSDARTIIPFDEFGFTHTGILELNVSSISLSDSSPDLDLSQLGFFLSTRDAWIHVLQQIQDLDVTCALQSELVKLVFTFDHLPQSASVPTVRAPEFGSVHQVSDPGQYTLLFANCLPQLKVSMSVHSAMYNLEPRTNKRIYLSAGSKRPLHSPRRQPRDPPMAEALTLTLLVDKERNRVVFAETDHRFVDILLSFLTLPMATIVRLLNGSSSLGSLDRLYKSVEDLDPRFLQSDACKSMLLRPRSVAGALCEGLPINVDDSDNRIYYKCSKSSNCGVSAVGGVPCKCGGCLDVPIEAFWAGKGKGGVFVKGEGRFMVSDDLMVRPVSMGESLVLLNRLGIEDGSVLEKKVVNVGESEVLSLLKRSIVSTMPLTDVFLQKLDINDVGEKLVVKDTTRASVSHKRIVPDSKRINVKLYLSSETDTIVYAEAGEDLVDLLFSFLTFPLGSVIKLLEKHSSIGCIDNLYDSVEVLSIDYNYIKSEDCKKMLLAPMLPSYFGCRHQLLSIEEVSPQMIRTCACKKCEVPTSDRGLNRCFHGMPYGLYHETNPRQQNSSMETGDGYTRGMVRFMVTDAIEVTPLSPISGFHIIKKLMVPISSLEEAEASLGEAEALDLLKTCLISETVLSNVFSPYALTLLEQNWCGRSARKCDGFLD